MRNQSIRKNPFLTRYWIEFARPLQRHGIRWLPSAVGVTAYSLDDALEIVCQYLYEYMPMPHEGESLPPVSTITEGIDVSTIERKHFGLGVPIWRGIWYPPIFHWDWPLPKP